MKFKTMRYVTTPAAVRRLVKKEADYRLARDIVELGGFKAALKEHICDNKEELDELFLFTVGEEIVRELEDYCNL
jgi:hypothetical protein